MAVDANTYGSHEDVERLIGDLVRGREFTIDTVPALATVEATLDSVAATINAELAAEFYVAPIVEADDPIAYAYAKRANIAGAAGRLLSGHPGAAMGNTMANPLLNRKTAYIAELDAFLEFVRKGRLRATRTESRAANFFVGSAYDDDGNTNLPAFTRDMDDYPGAHTRYEP